MAEENLGYLKQKMLALFLSKMESLISTAHFLPSLVLWKTEKWNVWIKTEEAELGLAVRADEEQCDQQVIKTLENHAVNGMYLSHNKWSVIYSWDCKVELPQ